MLPVGEAPGQQVHLSFSRRWSKYPVCAELLSFLGRKSFLAGGGVNIRCAELLSFLGLNIHQIIGLGGRYALGAHHGPFTRGSIGSLSTCYSRLVIKIKSKRTSYMDAPIRLRELQNSLSEAYNILAVSKRGVGSPARLRDLKNNLDEAFSMLQVSKRSAQVRVSW